MLMVTKNHRKRHCLVSHASLSIFLLGNCSNCVYILQHFRDTTTLAVYLTDKAHTN